MFNPAISKLTAPPVSVVQDWRAFYDGRLGELIDMSQAVPGYAAHPEMAVALEKAAGEVRCVDLVRWPAAEKQIGSSVFCPVCTNSACAGTF